MLVFFCWNNSKHPLPFNITYFQAFPYCMQSNKFRALPVTYIYTSIYWIFLKCNWCMHDIDSSVLTWNIRCSRTVNDPINRSSCWTYADMLLMSKLTGFPFRHTVPDTSTFEMLRCDNTFNKVVFPDPLSLQEKKLFTECNLAIYNE